MSQNRINMIVCGHIDHGKSTFVGRLLTELGLIPADRLDYLRHSMKPGQKLEYAQLLDALADEKSKGITIGLSQLAFKYQDQSYAFYDAPGHFEFMQNMITGASRADVAFLMIDAQEGLKESTLRHLYALSFIGVKDVVVLINKMDLVNYLEKRFLELTELIKSKMQDLGITFTVSIPIAADKAENFCTQSLSMAWYAGPLVVTMLTQFQQRADILLKDQEPTRFLVQDVFEVVSESKLRKIVFGELIQGDVTELKEHSLFSNSESGRIQLTANLSFSANENPFPMYQAQHQKSFAVEFSSIPPTRGSLVFEARDPSLLFSNELKCSLFWFGTSSLNVGEKVHVRLAKQEVLAEVTALENIFDCDNLIYQHDDHTLTKGRVGFCYFKTEQKLFFDYHTNEPKLGRLVLIKNNVISAAGKVCG